MVDVNYKEHTCITNYTWNVFSSKGMNTANCCLVFLVTMSQLNTNNKSQLETQSFGGCPRSLAEFLDD